MACASDKERRQWSITLCKREKRKIWLESELKKEKLIATGNLPKNIEHVTVFSIQRCCAVQVESESWCPFSSCLEAACHLDSHVIKI